MTIIVPSPELLIHGTHKNYVTQISLNERKIDITRQHSNPLKDDSTLNLSLMCLNGVNPTIRKARAYSSVLVSDLISSDNPAGALFYGALSAEIDDFPSAIYWFEIGIQKGSIAAIVAAAYLYLQKALILTRKRTLKKEYDHLTYDPANLNEALRWFYRAEKVGSIKSSRFIADIYSLFGTELQSFSFYMKYFSSIIDCFPGSTDFSLSYSLYAKYKLAKLFSSLNLQCTALVWLISCVDQGDVRSATLLIKVLREPKVLSAINEIKHIPDSKGFLPLFNKYIAAEFYEFQMSNSQKDGQNRSQRKKTPPHVPKIDNSYERNFTDTILDSYALEKVVSEFEFSKISKNIESTLEVDLSLPSYKNTSHFFWLISPLSNLLPYNLPKDSSLHSTYNTSHINQSKVWQLNEISGANINLNRSNTSVCCPLYPLNSKTNFLKLVFKFASPSFTKRNLGLSLLFLKKMYGLHPKGISESSLFRNRCKSSNPKYLVQCGFISMMLNDNQFALQLFEKAARVGNETASLMAGLMLFHGLNITKKKKAGCFYLSQCTTNPIALLHLSLACDDELWEKRAREILGMNPTYDPESASINQGSRSKLYEWVGDLFAHFVKFPINMPIAMMFYGVAMKKAEDDGEEITGIIQKMSNASREYAIDE